MGSVSLSYFVNGIKNHSEEVALKTAQELHHFAGTELKEMPVDESNNFLEQFNQKIFDLVSSPDYYDKRAGILAIMSLIGIDNGANSSRLSRCANYLRNMLPSSNQTLMELAAKAIGHLALSSETYTAEYVDFEARRAFEWLTGERNEERRHAAVLVLRELAICTPTIFVQHLQQYFETIFIALKDTKPAIRECAASSLRAVLNIVSQRETKDIHKPQWFQLSINQAFSFLQEAASKERSYSKEDKTHAGLLTLNELICIGCTQSETVKKDYEENFLLEKYKETILYKSPAKSKIKLDLSINFLQFQNQMFLDFIYSLMPGSLGPNKSQELTQSETCRQVLLQNYDLINNNIYKALSSRNMQVQLVLIEIIPRLAFLRPEKFNKSMMHNCSTFLINASKKELYKSASYLSIGYLIIAAKAESYKILPKIVECIKSAFSAAKEGPPKKKNTMVDPAVFACLRMMVETFESTIEAQIKDLLEAIFSCGLSPALVECLSDISTCIPALKRVVQENLLNYISAVITNKPYSYYTTMSYNDSSNNRSSIYSVTSAYLAADMTPTLGPIEIEKLSLAIKTLRNFNFNDYPLLGLVKHIADHHIYLDFPEVRVESVRTCFKLLYESTTPEKFNPLTFDKGRIQILTDILDRLIPLGVNDRKSGVRLAVFGAIDECYDKYLVQPKHLAVFCQAIHDVNFEVKENVVCLLGRLALIDPSSLLPLLRKLMLQLLTDIKDSGIGRNREHSSRLILLMIAHVPRLVQLYVPTILKVLTPLLKDPGPNPGVTIKALAAVGELALVCGLETRRWNQETFDIVVDMLKDGNLSSIREVALWTLGQLVESAGYVVEPYSDFPFLLDILMTFLRSEPTFRIRYETIRVMGIIGALDPFVYKNNLEKYNARKEKKENASKGPSSEDGEIEALPEDCSVNELWVSVNASLDDFYPCAAITCLMRILKDPTLAQHHTISVQAITFIFKSLGTKSHLYIRRVVPTFLTLIKTSENIREFLFQQLGIIASLVKVHLRNYLGEICTLVKDYWNQQSNLQSTVITLLNQLAVNMGPDIRPFLPELIPLMLKVLMYDSSSNKTNTQKLLATFQVLGNYMESYLHMLVPVMIDIIITSEQNPLVVRRSALETINILLQTSDMSEYASILIHPLLSLIDGYPQSGGAGTGGVAVNLLQTPSPPSLTNAGSSYLFHTINQQTPGAGSSMGEMGSNALASQNTTPELRTEALQALTSIVAQLGRRFLTLYAPLVSGVLMRNNITHPPYEMLLIKLLDGTDPSTQYAGGMSDSSFTCYDKLPTNLPDPSSKSLMDVVVPIKKLNINASTLQKSWTVKGRISKDDWVEWLKKFSIDILKESPSPSLRSCWALAQNYAPLAKDLFNASFVSCWMDLSEHYQDALVDNLQEALLNSEVPEVALTLLNLAEFMDHCEKGPLPLDTILLGQQAVKYRAYAKALRYKEEEFYKGPTPEILESLICINNKLKQHEASAGILKYALKNFPEELSTHESWYEKLDEWEAALRVYKTKMNADPQNESVKLGAMRCLEALGEWSEVLELGHEWNPSDPATQQKVATLACSASWGIGDWSSMERYVNFLPDKIQDGAFYRAVIAIKKNECDSAGLYISKCRDLLEPELTALASESYERAYNTVVMAQILSEMEEAIQYKLLPARQPIIKRMWWDRLLGCQKILSNWHKIIQVHSLVITPQEDQIPWLKYVSLCNKNSRFSLSHKTLTMLLGFDPTKQSDRALMLANPHVVFSYLKYMWKSGQKNDAFIKLSSFVSDHLQSKFVEILKSGDMLQQTEFRSLLAKCYLKMGQWSENLNGVTDASIPQILHYYVSAIDCSNNWYKAWHAWACTNFEALLYYKQHGVVQPNVSQDGKVVEEPKVIITPSKASTSKMAALLTELKSEVKVDQVKEGSKILKQPTSVTAAIRQIPSITNLNITTPTPKLPLSITQTSSQVGASVAGLLNYVILAVKGFIQSISFSQSSTSLQDTLRLLTLCFDYGQYPDVYEALQDGIKMIRIDNWLQVIPQLIARIDIPRPLVHKLIHQLLIEIGNFHPQALIYPLTVASKSDITSRQNAAKKILQALCEHNNTLVQQALMVSEELIRVSILWHELWHEGLEDASRLYFGEKNIRGMLAVLEPLHAMIEKGPQTLKETSFIQAYGRDLAEAKVWCTKYLQTANVKDLTQAWDLYYHVFRRISKELPQLTTLQLAHVSPKLMGCRDLELAVPGTYKICGPAGSDVAEKARLKERQNGAGSGLVRIARVMPTLQVISSKQRPRKLRILGDDGIEYLFLLKGHEDLRQDERVMQLFGLVNTLLRTDSETVRRNLVIQRYSVVPLSTNSGLISWVPHCDTLHTLIKDHRESRKILLNIEHKIMLRMAPDYDRLTLYQKTEVFEHALEHTKGDDLARVLWLKSPPNSQDWFDRRLNYTRSLALMSVVGYILGLGDRHPSNLMLDRVTGKILHIDFGDCFEVAMSREKFPEKVPFRLTRMLINAMEVSGIEGTFRMTCERVMEVLQLNKDSVMSVLEAFVYDPLINWRLLDTEDQPESLNLKALAIIKKVKEKLTGRDFNPNETLDIKTQIELLIKQATSHENLCEMYIGWCPFW